MQMIISKLKFLTFLTTLMKICTMVIFARRTQCSISLEILIRTHQTINVCTCSLSGRKLQAKVLQLNFSKKLLKNHLHMGSSIFTGIARISSRKTCLKNTGLKQSDP
ncbi:hypothetical protein PBCV1_A655L [Paramecium bursaria Chlorella virus 1]|uniref:Uncharacterized protein n=1 Tax=Paramecium bursaria Chlorella virus 1 TaxID=10506 RepID=O41137_PBCV1|nr:hypothetical protein PBCV1_A655L [Paramecium bursaria Chlorella virus 1]AAC97039.1 hypothetical protein [Paramecium bursaria Chlorella virus 1]